MKQLSTTLSGVNLHEGESRINYRLIEIESEYSNCFSRIRDHEILKKKIDF